jgi:hypothetical protein
MNTGTTPDCGQQTTQDPLHEFMEWALCEGVCEETRTCTRCGHIEKRHVLHTFGRWEYTAPDSCELTAVCTHCGLVGSVVIHEWESEWEYIGTTRYRLCPRCLAEDSEDIGVEAEGDMGQTMDGNMPRES